MANTKIIAVAAVVVLAVAGVSAVLVLNNGNSDKSPTSHDYGGELLVYGNANADSVIDSNDIDYIKAVIKGDKENYTFCDANRDGKVDEKDVDYVQDLIDRKDGTVVYYIDGSKSEASLTWPVKTAVVLDSSPQLMARAVGICYPNLLAYTKVDSVIFKSFEGAKVISTSISDTETVMSNGVPDILVIGHMSAVDESARTIYNKAGVDIVRVAGMDGVDSISSALTLGFLCGNIEQSQAYAQWCHDMIDDIQSKVASIPQDKLRKGFIWYGSMAVAGVGGSGQAYADALKTAGGISLGTWENYQKLTADNNTWILNYNDTCDFVIRVSTMGYSVDSTARQAVYDKSAALIPELQAYKDGKYCVIDFNLPQILRIAYMAEFLYPDVFGEGFGDSWHQKYLDLGGVEYTANGQFLWTANSGKA